jgi:hypothetical protein
MSVTCTDVLFKHLSAIDKNQGSQQNFDPSRRTPLLTRNRCIKFYTTSLICSQINTYLLILTDLSPSREATNCATTQVLPSILWNPKVYYRARKSPPLVPLTSWSS